MRRFDKKKNILAANLRLEQERLFERMNLDEIDLVSQGLPYEEETNNDFRVKIKFKVPKEPKDITSEDPSTEWNMYASASSTNKTSRESVILAINGGDVEAYGNLPENVFGIHVSFGVLNDPNNMSSVSYPELKTTKLFAIMATVKNMVNQYIQKLIDKGGELFMIDSMPLSGNDEFRERLYNLYYDLEIKKSKIVYGFKKFNARGLSGIYNANLIKGTDDAHANVKTIDTKRFEVKVYSDGNEELYNKFWDYVDYLNDKNIYKSVSVEWRDYPKRHIYYVNRSISKEGIKTFLKNFKEKYGMDLEGNSVELMHGKVDPKTYKLTKYKTISGINDPYLN